VDHGGLSPLARGTHQASYFRNHQPRFIPAGAGNSRIEWGGKGVDAVYPRWRGELDSDYLITGAITGLSPLARGTLKKEPGITLRSRFIPAGAGNSKFDPKKFRRLAVYPRWRGELPKAKATERAYAGLSPLARGTPSQSACDCAFSAVYPRWRGELSKIA